MEKTSVQKLAGVLKLLVTITFICNLVALFLVPGCSRLRSLDELVGGALYFSNEGSLAVAARMVGYFVSAWQEVWLFGGPYAAVLTSFLLFCGVCTAVILWQARRVLDTILAGNTFTFENAANMRRAAICCFLISAAALGRTVWGLCFYRSLMPLLTYNALFVPIFLMAGLLCMVMSALFRQAAELKAENDLTI